jgi:hypothetical protein
VPNIGASLLGLLLIAAVAVPVEAAHVRVTCRGVQEFSLSEPEVSCYESSALTDADGRIMFGHTAAGASLTQGKLTASASGGAIRDVGYNGGEASALLMDKVVIEGEWQGSVPVTVSMWIAYKFAGYGESRFHAALGASVSEAPPGDNRVAVRLRHRGFNQATLSNVVNDGSNRAPEDGSYPAQSILTMSVTEMVTDESPFLVVRARLDGYALPNLDAINPTAASLVDVEARISVSLPEHLRLRSESGLFLAKPP